VYNRCSSLRAIRMPIKYGFVLPAIRLYCRLCFPSRRREIAKDYNPDMTESTPDTSSGTSTTDSKEHGTQVKPGQAVPSSPRSRRTGSRKGLVTALVIAILLLIALAAALWYQQQSFRLAHDNLTAQLQQGNQVSRAAEARADEALQLAKTQSEQLAQLQATVEQSQSQVHSLQQALQMLTDTGSNL